MVNHSTNGVAQPCWIDLVSSELYYTTVLNETLFGWRAGSAWSAHGSRFIFIGDGAPSAGARANAAPGATLPRGRVHIDVDDVELTLRRAVEHGAAVIEGAEPIGERGVRALIADPSGAPRGRWKPHDDGGSNTRFNVNAPRWFELRTSGYEVAVPIYRDVFDGDLRETSVQPGTRHATAHDGHEVRAFKDTPCGRRSAERDSSGVIFRVMS